MVSEAAGSPEVDKEYILQLYLKASNMADSVYETRGALIFQTCVLTAMAMLLSTAGRNDNDLGYWISVVYALSYVVITACFICVFIYYTDQFIASRAEKYYVQMLELGYLPLKPGHKLRFPLIKHSVLSMLYVGDIFSDRDNRTSPYTDAVKQYYHLVLSSRCYPFIDCWSVLEAYSGIILLAVFFALYYCGSSGLIVGGQGISYRAVPVVAATIYSITGYMFLSCTRRLAWCNALSDLLDLHSNLWSKSA